MVVSVVIPVQKINAYIQETCRYLKELEFRDFEVLIFSDEAEEDRVRWENELNARIIPTGKVSPAVKRDMSLRYARGEILAFLDDDAFPRGDWLTRSLPHVGDPKVAAVGGPAVTPSHDSFWQKVSGAVFLSKMGGGNPERYWPVGKVREVVDWPSVNLLVRREIFEQVGGFHSTYWPGEDTKLCLDIIKQGSKIIYDPEVVVWHHRRRGLIRHLKQIGRYGLHRGFFAKAFPETSRQLKYFLPSFFMIFSVAGILTLFWWDHPWVHRLYLLGLLIYSLALLWAFFQIQQREKNYFVALVSLPYIFLTHLWYGARFLEGFLWTRDLTSKLRVAGE
jgi:cellulose synthase/poly-beta-1,6-N-acetylglucosamine synthase-like glycosyltransferase